MPDYKPLPVPPIGNTNVNDLGTLLTEFDGFRPDPKFSFNGRAVPDKEAWKTIKPQAAPPITPLPLLIQKLLKATWKRAEPSRNNTQGAQPGKAAHGITIGTRGPAVAKPTFGNLGLFTAHVRPTTPIDASGNQHGIETTFPNDSAIASDWKIFKTIPRTNAVTFRGDSRSPNDVISKAGGFYPPNSRTDRYYLENNIYTAFADYLKRRCGRDITNKQFLAAVDETAILDEEKKLLVDYLMWRKITEKEAVHLGRMVETECLKGYISTARGIDTSLFFATGYHSKPGWLYLTVVYGGFVVPLGDKKYWGTEEGEIAQWGPIPAKRIVGFVHVHQHGIPDGPIFIRRSFRLAEPKVYEHMFKVMSGMLPSQGTFAS